MSLELLGVDSGLKSQYIVVRIVAVDAEKFRKALGAEAGWRGATAAAAISLSDSLPKAVLDVGLPAAAALLKERYGVEVKLSAADAPPAEERSWSEFFPGIIVGAGLTGAVLAVVHLIRRVLV